MQRDPMMTRTLTALTALLLVSACDPDDTDNPGTFDPVPFAGEWVDGFDGLHTVTDETWTMGTAVFLFVDVNADNGTIIAENDPDNEYNPGAYSRFDWVQADGETWFCQTAYDAATAADAADTPAADATDPATGGCGGFAWSRLYVPLALRGDWTDNWGSAHVIREWTWTMDGVGVFNVSDYDNAERVLIAQNDPANEYNPGKWSRFDWVEVEDTFYMCQTAFAADTEADARAAAAADATDPTTGGCGEGSFPWSSLTATE